MMSLEQTQDRKEQNTDYYRVKKQTEVMSVHAQLSCVWLFTTPWTVAHQGPLSMEFAR